MRSILQFATLSYGRRQTRVVPTTNVPIPTGLDVRSPFFLTHVRNILAMMSNAGGGHPVRNCKVSVFRDSVNITGDGVHVFFKDPTVPPLEKGADDEETTRIFLEYMNTVEGEQVVTELGNVVTDQYGDGWMRAVWST